MRFTVAFSYVIFIKLFDCTICHESYKCNVIFLTRKIWMINNFFYSNLFFTFGEYVKNFAWSEIKFLFLSKCWLENYIIAYKEDKHVADPSRNLLVKAAITQFTSELLPVILYKELFLWLVILKQKILPYKEVYWKVFVLENNWNISLHILKKKII